MINYDSQRYPKINKIAFFSCHKFDKDNFDSKLLIRQMLQRS